MKKCIIITSYIEGNLSDFVDIQSSNFIICADGGYNYAKKAGIIPDILIGDFDSIEESVQAGIEIVTVPSEKDDTDTGLCIKHALDMGYREILIVGGIGGRFDHAVANVQIMAESAPKLDRISMVDRNNFCTILVDGEIQIEKQRQGQHLSLLSLSDVCLGVSVTGVKYPLYEHTLTSTFPLGVSNEFTEDWAVISVMEGTLLIVLSQD